MNYYSGAIRTCDGPRCCASYDAVAVMSGQASAKGWLHGGTFSITLCPLHTWLHDTHMPRVGPGQTGVCSCGQQLTAVQSTIGGVKDAWQAHVAALESP